MSPTIVALIPARAGSKRCQGKNTRLLGGKPLIQWTIEAAKASGILDQILVSTNLEFPDSVKQSGAAFLMRPEPLCADDSPDIAWVQHALPLVKADAFAILRPTSPFRTADTIRRAWRDFQERQPCDSIRAVEMVRQHPLKMWLVERGDREMRPLLPEWRYYDGIPLRDPAFHSLPFQVLPACYVQNASLEIAWTKTVLNRGTIAGDRVMPFFTEGVEGFDINTEDDFTRAEQIAASLVTL